MKSLQNICPGRGTPQPEGRRSSRPAMVGAMPWVCACFFSLLFAPVVFAESLLLSGATVHTVSGETLQPGHVLVREGKIVTVSSSVPAGADRTLDLSGLHLFPGLIETATTLGLNEIPAVRATLDNNEVGDYTPEVEAWVSVNPDSELIPVARANGLTHVQIVPSGGVVAGQGSVIRLAGWTIEDHAVVRRSGLQVYWPSLALNTSPDNKKSLADQDRERKQAVRELNDFFDEAAAYDRARNAGGAATALVPSWEAMRPYVRGEARVFIHADELRQLKAALAWLQERRLQAVIIGARDAWQMADELAAAGVPVVYKAVHVLPRDPVAGYDIHFRAPAVLAAAGVKLALGLGPRFSESMARNLPYEAAQALAYGLPPAAALRSVTLGPAEALGIADRLGSIEAGKDATLIAVDGDILDIRSNVKRMWMGGEEVSLESRHTRLHEKYRNRPHSD